MILVRNLSWTRAAVGAAVAFSCVPAMGYDVGWAWGFTGQDLTRPTGVSGAPLEGPIRLTWQVVDDDVPVFENYTGTTVPNQGMSFLESTFGTHPTATNPLLQPWYAPLGGSFDRIEELSGVDFRYEFFDDGAAVTGSNTGIFTVRGDIRIAGLPLTDMGQPAGLLAYNFPPNNGDMVINTNNAAAIGDPADNFRNARNLFTHELMHGLGVRHNDFSTSALMYPSTAGQTFDGPQFDDIAALHQLYNDASDRIDASLMNPEHVFNVSASQKTFLLGIDASDDTTVVTPDQTDFVSVTNQDKDYFAFTLQEQGTVIFSFLPVGPNYNDGISPQTSAKHISRLTYKLYDPLGKMISTDTADALGETVGYLGVLDPGTFRIELSGNSAYDDTVQMYQHALIFVPQRIPGDTDNDGDIDDSDLGTSFANYTGPVGALGGKTAADGDVDGDGDVDDSDLGSSFSNYTGPTAINTPEPTSLALFGLGGLLVARRRR